MKLRPFILGGALVLGGCADSTAPKISTTPSTPASSIQLSRTVALSEFSDTVTASNSRLEIRVVPGTLTASRVEIERPGKMTADEKVESRGTAIDRSGTTGALTLSLGGLKIGFNGATAFRDDRDSSITQDQFVQLVQDALAAGRSPGVEAKRPPATTPQGPSDPTFLATEIHLSDDPENEIDLNVTKANFVANSAPPPDAWIKVLGIQIAIMNRAGETELRDRLPEQGEAENESEHGDSGASQLSQDVEFHGNVKAVQSAAGTLTLDDGTIVRIVAGTGIESGGDHLSSLAAVAQTLGTGAVVEAHGEGKVETATPRTIVAIEIRLRLQD